MQIIAEDTLIFFDEIQACPNALNSLKYFYEQAKEYYVISAGSLLGLLNLKKDGKVCNYPLYLLEKFPCLNTRLPNHAHTTDA